MEPGKCRGKIRELQQQLRQRGGQRREEEEASGAAASGGSIKLRWRDGGRAPRRMHGEAAAVNGSVAYFLHGDLGEHTVLKYDCAKRNWSELHRCPNRNFSLAMVNNLLTTIGGKTPEREHSYQLTPQSHYNKKWKKQLSQLSTLRVPHCMDTCWQWVGGIPMKN